ncbi:MAG: ferric reductase-like transmembrane domain-containing protein [Actinomycetota bacterium]|nr:ferric reductase-like transmembrane domain-containing protein [Actinomycetota bacterium]
MLGLAATTTQAYWYLTRATGAVSLLLLTAVVVLGVLGSLRFGAAPRWPRFAVDSLHRDLSLLAIGLLVLHVITSVLDSFAPISIVEAVVPFTGTYRPLWLGLGALAFDFMIVLVLTSLVRRRLGYGAWRAIHWLAYASWPIAVLHGLGTGSDTKQVWMLALTVACVAAMVIAILVRIARAGPVAERIRGPATVLSVLAPIGLAIFTLAGPLETGWARRAGTPAPLLAHSSSRAVASARVSRPARRSLGLPFSARLQGTLKQTSQAGGAILDIALRLSGGHDGRLRIRLAGAPLGGGGLSLTGSQVDFVAAGLPSVLAGRVVQLQGTQFLARVADASGSSVNLQANLQIDNQTGAVTGTLSATSAAGGSAGP